MRDNGRNGAMLGFYMASGKLLELEISKGRSLRSQTGKVGASFPRSKQKKGLETLSLRISHDNDGVSIPEEVDDDEDGDG